MRKFNNESTFISVNFGLQEDNGRILGLSSDSNIPRDKCSNKLSREVGTRLGCRLKWHLLFGTSLWGFINILHVHILGIAYSTYINGYVTNTELY